MKNAINFLIHKGNKYGSLNKGSGLIENWNYCKFKLNQYWDKYEYIIHFEPRQLLKSDKFFTSLFPNIRFLAKATPFIESNTNSSEIYTGLFCIQRSLLDYFLINVTEFYLVQNKICIENILYDIIKYWITNHNYNYDLLETLDLLRFDAYTGITYHI